MKADRLDYNNKNVIIDRLFADFEGLETEIPQIKATNIYEEQEISQLVGLQASIVTIINQFLIWQGILETINSKLEFYNKLTDNKVKLAYFNILKAENTPILRLYKEIVVFQHIILALKNNLNLAYGTETANGTIEAEKIILRKPVYKKDFKYFEEKVSDKKAYLSSYSALVRGLSDLVNVEIENDKETTWL